MAEVLIDTNVLSRVFTGDKAVKEFIENLDAAVCMVVYIECLQGSKSNREKRIVESYLSRFELHHRFQHFFSHHRTDSGLFKYARLILGRRALIAASCLEHNLTLVTYNVKDFTFIGGLKHLAP